MTEVRSQLKIDAPAERIFEALADSNLCSEWLPNQATPASNGDSNGFNTAETIGPKYYHRNLCSTLEERATEWDAGRSYAYAIENFGPIKSAYVSFYATPVADGTLLTETVNFQMKYGLVGSALDTMVFRPQFRKQMELSLKSLKNFLEASAPLVATDSVALAA